ncbi:GntR family transcriptional regulator [Pelagibius marinus]|uniref:GntR family transcriptional regulator n=1 Tax=Pelagibius marinus TaxID=2762760 RepID=UPI0018724462|nr:GntR family transcriptional regulator [Pelagibius marinus]
MKPKAAPLARELRDRLEGEILSGQRPPGSRLDESKLAQHFGVSRTPVREALRELAAADLVVLRPRQGAVVATVTVTQLLHMFEVMAELESFCAKLAARRMSAEERDQLLQVHEDCRELAEKGEAHAYYDANRCFHEVIYAGTHNTYLEETTRNMRNRLQPYRRFQLHHPGRTMKSWKEHRAVVDAILDGNAEAAAKAMSHHVTIQGDVFTDLISALPESYVHAMTA